MMMFGFVAGVVLTFAGVGVLDNPIMFVACLIALAVAHLFLPQD
jgi:hypothetical protein